MRSGSDRVKNKFKLILSFLPLVSFTPLTANALGMGEAHVHSKLNEPLNVELDLLSIGDLDLGSVIPDLASADDFAKAGLERPFSLGKIQFKIEQDKNGKSIVRLTTNEPIKDPFITLVVEMNWPTGRIMREYTLLLDPPDYVKLHSSTPKTNVKTNTNQIAETNETNETNDPYKTKEQPSALAPIKAKKARNVVKLKGKYGPIKQNEKLWHIAKGVVKDTNYSVHEGMQAIIAKNPKGFVNNDMDKLLANQYLDLPIGEEIGALSQTYQAKEATQGKRAVPPLKLVEGGGVVDLTNPTPNSTPTQQSIPEMPKSEISTLPANAALQAPNTNNNGALPQPQNSQTQVTPTKVSTSLDVNQRVKQLEESVDTLQTSNQSLQRAQSALQNENTSLNAVVQLKEQEILALKAQLSALHVHETTASSSGSIPTPTTTAITAGAVTPTATPAAVSPTQSMPPAQPSSVVASENAAVIDSSMSGLVHREPPAPELKEHHSNALWLLFAGIFTVLLGSLVFFREYVRKHGLILDLKWFAKKKGADFDFPQEEPLPHALDKLEKNEDEASQPLPDMNSEESFNIDEAIKLYEGHEEPHSLSVQKVENSRETGDSTLEDADVYLNFGKIGLAESVIQSLLEKNPQNIPALLKLFDIYISSNNPKEAQNVLTRLPQDYINKFPVKITELQKKITSLKESVNSESAFQPTKPLEQKVSDVKMEAPVTTTATPTTTQPNLQNTVLHTNEPKDVQVERVEARPEGEELRTIDFEDSHPEAIEDKIALEGKDKETLTKALENRQTPEGFLGEIEEIEATPLPNNENVLKSLKNSFEALQTKLDLAQVYLTMNDKESAKELLTDVATNGNEEQKLVANQLLKDKFST